MPWKRSEDVRRGDVVTDVGHVMSASPPDRHGTIPLKVVPTVEMQLAGRDGGRTDPVRPASLGVGGVVEVETSPRTA